MPLVEEMGKGLARSRFERLIAGELVMVRWQGQPKPCRVINAARRNARDVGGRDAEKTVAVIVETPGGGRLFIKADAHDSIVEVVDREFRPIRPAGDGGGEQMSLI